MMPGSFGCPAFFCLLILSGTEGPHMPMTRAIAVSLLFVALLSSKSYAQQTEAISGNPERGKVVYRSVGYCGNCHGWPGDGLTGLLLQAPRGANLRETKLDGQALFEVIKCGLPGTPMPFHGRTAYKTDLCYGKLASDFEPDEFPRRGKTFSDKDIANLVVYLQSKMIGLGIPTFEECADFFDNSNASACRSLR